MAKETTPLSVPGQLALLAAVILNIAIAIVHVLGFLIGEHFPVWTILPYLDGVITVVLSWQLFQLVDTHRINFGFQLGGLLVVGTFILDLFLYIIPKPGTVTDTIGQLHQKLLLHYGVIFFAPFLIAILRTLWIQLKE